MLNIINLQENANKTTWDTAHLSEELKLKREPSNVGGEVKYPQLSYIASRCVKSYNHSP